MRRRKSTLRKRTGSVLLSFFSAEIALLQAFRLTGRLFHISPGSALFMVTKMALASVMTDQNDRFSMQLEMVVSG